MGRPHETLDVYRLAHALALRVHAVTMRLPKHEMYEEGSQSRRSGKSVSAQLVEGHALRNYKPEYLHYLARAYGSAEETLEHLRYLTQTGSASQARDECDSLIEDYTVLCRRLFSYIRSVKKGHDSSALFEENERWREKREES